MSRVFWANKSVFWHFHAFDDLQSYWPYLCHSFVDHKCPSTQLLVLFVFAPTAAVLLPMLPWTCLFSNCISFFQVFMFVGRCWIMLGLCVFYVIVCCCLDSLESVATLPIGRECPPSILFSHLFTNSLFRIRPPVQTHTHIQSHTHITHTTSIHLCMFFLAALQQGFACTLGKSESCC